MRIAKKCMWVVIALLPVLVYLFSMVAHLGNDIAGETIGMGTITITEAADGFSVACTPNSWGELLIAPLYGQNAVGGLYGALAGFVHFLSVNAGIPASVPSFFAVLCLAYLTFVELVGMLLDFVLFVPRKCAELFR